MPRRPKPSVAVLCECLQNAGMPVNITIRNVPSKVRDTLAARAARAGKSLQEYLRGEMVALAEKPSIDEWLERVRKRKAESPVQVTTEEILAYRDADRR